MAWGQYCSRYRYSARTTRKNHVSIRWLIDQNLSTFVKRFSARGTTPLCDRFCASSRRFLRQRPPNSSQKKRKDDPETRTVLLFESRLERFYEVRCADLSKLEYLAHHPLRLPEVASTEKNVVVQDMVDVVHDLPLLVAIRQRPLLLVPGRGRARRVDRGFRRRRQCSAQAASSRDSTGITNTGYRRSGNGLCASDRVRGWSGSRAYYISARWNTKITSGAPPVVDWDSGRET